MTAAQGRLRADGEQSLTVGCIAPLSGRRRGPPRGGSRHGGDDVRVVVEQPVADGVPGAGQGGAARGLAHRQAHVRARWRGARRRATRASRSCGGCSSPVRAWSTTSSGPPDAGATTGTPLAIASWSDWPKVSWRRRAGRDTGHGPASRRSSRDRCRQAGVVPDRGQSNDDRAGVACGPGVTFPSRPGVVPDRGQSNDACAGVACGPGVTGPSRRVARAGVVRVTCVRCPVTGW